MDELQRAVVGLPRLLGAAEPLQQLRAGGVQVVVALEVEGVGQGQRGLDLARLGQRGRPVELDDGRAGERGEVALEPGQPRPVLGLVQVQGRDLRLERVRPAAPEPLRTPEARAAYRDLLVVPE